MNVPTPVDAKIPIASSRKPPPGSAPGTIIESDEAHPTRLRLTRYDASGYEDLDASWLDRIEDLLTGDKVVWIAVEGLRDAALFKRIAESLGIHRLALEDVFNTPQNSKAEAYDGHLFCIVREPRLVSGLRIDFSQVNIFLGRNWVLSIRETLGDEFEMVRRRIDAGNGVIRQMGSDYLAYALLDAVIDHYYPVLDRLGDQLETLEAEALERAEKATLGKVNRIRTTLLHCRRALTPQSEALYSMVRDESELISEPVKLYLRDTLDHCRQISGVVESYREILAGVSQTWLASAGNRTNEVMKVLTIMASLFIPLNFLAALYGMNFDYMPELHVAWAYPVLLATMATLGLGMIGFFYRKGWLSAPKLKSEDDS